VAVLVHCQTHEVDSSLRNL